jgi:hypothetical protein
VTGDAWNIGLNIIASVITGSVVWISGRLLRLRRLRRKQVFFGLSSGGECLLVVPRMVSADNERSVHRNTPPRCSTSRRSWASAARSPK